MHESYIMIHVEVGILHIINMNANTYNVNYVQIYNKYYASSLDILNSIIV